MQYVCNTEMTRFIAYQLEMLLNIKSTENKH